MINKFLLAINKLLLVRFSFQKLQHLDISINKKIIISMISKLI